jgi:hypothetical protein
MRRIFALITTITLSIGLISFPTISWGEMKENTNLVQEQENIENAKYEEVIILTEQDIKELGLEEKKSLDSQKHKEGSKKYINIDVLEIDLEHPEVMKAKKAALKAGHKWGLDSLTIVTTFKKDNGEFLTNKEYKKIIEEREKYGKEKSFKIKKDIVRGQRSLALVLEDQGVDVRTFMTSYAYSYHEDNGTQRRHYVLGKHVWSGTWSWGAIDTHNYDYSDDILVNAWGRGSIASTAPRDAYVRYENYSGQTMYKDENQLVKITDSGSPSLTNAFKVKEKPNTTNEYAIKQAEVYNYTGYYTRSMFGEDAEFKTSYAHGFSSHTLNLSVSAGFPWSVSIDITADPKAVWEKAQAYALMKRN